MGIAIILDSLPYVGQETVLAQRALDLLTAVCKAFPLYRSLLWPVTEEIANERERQRKVTALVERNARLSVVDNGRDTRHDDREEDDRENDNRYGRD